VVQAAYAADLSYRVTLDKTRPVKDAYVTLQSPGGAKTIVTKTDESGKFSVSGVKADKLLMTIEKNGKLVYRGITKVDPAPVEQVIDLTEQKSKWAAKSGTAGKLEQRPARQRGRLVLLKHNAPGLRERQSGFDRSPI
jgi:hypothetical protein